MAMTLTVLSIAYPFASVSLDATGGAEQILAILDEELVSRGHRSIVVACEGSQICGELVPAPRPLGELDDRYRESLHFRYRRLIDEAIDAHRPDIVHMHGVDASAYLPETGPPILVTMHLPPSFYADGAFSALEDRGAFLNCVSKSQRRAFPDISRMQSPVENGIRVDDYEYGATREPFVLALGRICPEKGYHLALDAARLAKAPMLLAGQVFPYEAHDRYFLSEVVPRLDLERRFIGPIALEQKRRLLGEARCLLIPSLVEETSSLVAMEALASGTPVIAYRSGALLDIIEDGVTGFLVESAEEMAEAIHRVNAIDEARCRQIAEARFSARSMASRYIELYERILRQGARSSWIPQPVIQRTISSSKR